MAVATGANADGADGLVTNSSHKENSAGVGAVRVSEGVRNRGHLHPADAAEEEEERGARDGSIGIRLFLHRAEQKRRRERR